MTSAPSEDGPLDPVAGTARWTAAERAREADRPDRLFEDPLAEALAGEEGRALGQRMRRGGLFDNPGFAVRTRFFDDALTASLSRPDAASQVVLVAAGMDTRAYRLALPPELAWYELDRPDLLALKDRVLTEAGATPRCARHPVGVDLTAEWAGPLTAAGFDPTRPAVWLAEGLIFYLDPDAVHRLLDEITRLSAPGSELFIDTIGQSLLQSPQMRPMRDRLAEHGIPWRFGTDQPEDDLFAPRGWRAAASLTAEVGTRLGRWPSPAFPRDTRGVPQSFLVHATR
jgi:methyltransferase (TIGR00027 family)